MPETPAGAPSGWRPRFSARELLAWQWLVLLAGLLVTLAVIAMTLWAKEKYWEAAAELDHARSEIVLLGRLSESVSAYASEARGFVLFGSDASRARMLAARSASAEALAQIRRGEHAGHGDAIARLAEELSALHAYYDGVTVLVQGPDHRAAEARLRSGEGAQRIDGLRAILQGVVSEKERAIARLHAEAAARETRIWLGSLAAVLLQAAVLIVLGAGMLGTQLRARERHARALAASEALQRAVFEQAAVGIALVGADRRIRRANPRLAELLGRPAETLAGATLKDLSHPEDLGVLDAARERLYSGAAASVAAEKRYLRADGSTAWARVTISLLRGADAAPPHEIAVFEDISAERAAAAGQRRFRAALETSGAAVFIMARRSMQVADVNEAACRLLGEPRAALLGRPSNSVFAEPDLSLERQAERFDEVIASGKAQPAVRRELRRADGSTVPVELHRSALVIDGEPFLVGVAHDLSARLAAEKALEESEVRYGKLVELSPEAIFASQDGHVVFANPAALRLFGARDAAELLGRAVLDLVHPSSRALVEQRLRAFAAGAKEQPRIEARYLRLDGAPVDVEVASVRFRYKGARAVLMVARDISEQKRAQNELREAKERLQLAIDASGASIWVTDLAGGKVYLSEGWARMLGEESGETRTTLDALAAITHPDDLERVAAASRRVIRGDAAQFEEEHRVRAHNGEWLWVRTGGRVVARDANGRALRLTGTNFDISQQKREERILQLEHSTSRLLAEAQSARAGLQATIRAICQTEGWEAGRYFRADEQAGLLRFVTAWNTPDAALAPFIAGSARLTFTRGEGIAGRVWVSGEPIWIPEVSADSRVVNVTLSSETRIRSLFVFPVTAEGRTIGVLATFSRLARAPDERLMQAVHVLGSQLGQFLQRMDAEERLALHARRQERIARFGQYAIGETDLDRLYAEALQAVTGDGFADAASVVEVAGGSLVVRAAKGQGADPMRGFAEPLAQDSLWPEMLAANAPRVAGREYLQSFSARPEWRSFTRSMASAVHVPLHAESLHGMLVAYSEREHAFDNDDARAVEAIANILSTALRRRAAEERLAVLAQFDPLTGLPNRALFRDRLEQALAQAVRNRWQVGLLFIDLDRFKWVNDSLGHATGDELLNAVGKRLHACLRAGDTVARLGGDEFAVVLPDLDSPEAAGVVAEKMLEALKAPFAIAEQEMFAGASIGITVFPPDAADAEAMLRNADAAMYRAKEAGRGRYEFFTPAMNTEALRKLALEKDLRQALARSEFELHYQPKAEVESGRITGVEALLRWRRADGALVSPAEFIPVLEDTGLIAEVGDWVIGEACRQHDAWRRAGLDGMCVAVNVSARQFQGGRLLDSVRRALAQNECPAQCLELELTESLVMHDVDVTIETLQALREMGVRIAVDDFGTGYSSLAYLKKLPIDVVKIDRSFVKGVNDDANDAAIASAIIAMARSLGYRVVAEGVETPLQRQFLEALGCHEMQGWLLGRPMPAAEAARWLAGRAA